MLTTFNPLWFWIGFISASIVWAVALSLRPVLAGAWQTWQKQQAEARARAEGGIEDTYRRVLYRQSQEMHLASSLFALDELFEAPRLLAPPAAAEPGETPPHQDITAQALPYLRDWPEIPAFYNANQLTLAEALSGDANLLLLGQPGSGKSSALALLAAQLANRAPETAALNDRIPFLLHAADLPSSQEAKRPEDLLTPFIEQESPLIPLFERSRLPGFIQNAFQSGRALLLLDGLDELPQDALQSAASWLKLLLRAYPKIRVVASGAPEYGDGLPGLQFFPLALLPWTKEQQTNFIQRWDTLWRNYVANEAWAQMGEQVNFTLLRRWLLAENLNGLTPLELTLKVWAAYAGDARGPRPADAIEAHLRRLAPPQTPLEALHTLGAQVSLSGSAFFEEKSAREWLKRFEPPPAPEAASPAEGALLPESALPTEAGTNAPAEAESASAAPAKKGKNRSAGEASTVVQRSLPSYLLQYGLLKAHSQNRLRFSHPVFGGWLAGSGLQAEEAQTLLQQPAWSGKTMSLRYLAAFGDASGCIQGLLQESDPLLKRPLLLAGRMLREAPRSAAWRGAVLAGLMNLLRDEESPLALRAQAMAALSLSGDPNLPALFRQLLAAGSSTGLTQLSALACGLLRDVKAVDLLKALLARTSGAAQQAICLALAAIGSAPALEAIAAALLQGSEELRLTAAEALANDRLEGHEALREGIGSEDILVRRSIAYALGRVREPWADQILEHLQIEEKEWVVRSAATDALNARQQNTLLAPRRLTPPSDTPWLLELAGRQGMGIPPGQFPTDLLLQALRGDDEAEYRGALRYLRLAPSEGVIAALYQEFFNLSSPKREDIFGLLSEYGFAGISLPEPLQFGLG